MDDVTTFQTICHLFSSILDYPGEETGKLVHTLRDLLVERSVDGVSYLERFGTFIVETSPAGLEEAYTRTFDLQPSCYPYAGYHLFGESYRRGEFMARLAEVYRKEGYNGGRELPDHFRVILEFLSRSSDGEQREILVRGCLIPVVGKMISFFADDLKGYGYVLNSLRLFLESSEVSGVKVSTPAGEPS